MGWTRHLQPINRSNPAKLFDPAKRDFRSMHSFVHELDHKFIRL